MKLQHLLQEQETPFSYIKKINAEFKAMAAEVDITLVAGMGWPKMNKDGGWMGGGFSQKGGNKTIDDFTVELEHRVDYLIKQIAKKLEEYIAAGQVVKVAAGGSTGAKTDIIVGKGEALQKLKAGLIMTIPPGQRAYDDKKLTVAWFVGFPAALSGSESFSLEGAALIDGKTINYTITTMLPIEDSKNYAKWIENLSQSTSAYYNKKATEKQLKDNKAKQLRAYDAVATYVDKIGASVPNKTDRYKPTDGWMIVRRKIATKEAQFVEPEHIHKIMSIMMGAV